MALDISLAFLKGVSYEELSKATGEPRREVNLELDADSIQMLRTIPGFEDFNPQTEVLLYDRPGRVCKDAPRAWNIQLSKATNAVSRVIADYI